MLGPVRVFSTRPLLLYTILATVETTRVDSMPDHIQDQLTCQRPSQTFLSLPMELRSLVYKNILDDTIRPPLHPWDDLPTPRMYLSLLLINREIMAEIEDFFKRLYSDKLVLYFDDLLDIHWVWQNMDRWPMLKNARFWSQALLDNVGNEGDAKTDGTLMLIDRQSGFKEEWSECPGWFKTDSTDERDYDYSNWDPEADGFTQTTISHKACSRGPGKCLPFKKLVFPLMEHGHRITTCRWREDGPLEDADIKPGEELPVDSGVMVLEGRFDELSFEDVPVEVVRNRMACQYRELNGEVVDDDHKDCGCYPPLREIVDDLYDHGYI